MRQSGVKEDGETIPASNVRTAVGQLAAERGPGLYRVENPPGGQKSDCWNVYEADEQGEVRYVG